MMLLVPANPLRPHLPNDHFAPEAHAAREAGISVAVVNHDALTRDNPHRAVAAVAAGGIAVYRGWMFRSDQNTAFAEARPADSEAYLPVGRRTTRYEADRHSRQVRVCNQARSRSSRSRSGGRGRARSSSSWLAGRAASAASRSSDRLTDTSPVTATFTSPRRSTYP